MSRSAFTWSKNSSGRRPKHSFVWLSTSVSGLIVILIFGFYSAALGQKTIRSAAENITAQPSGDQPANKINVPVALSEADIQETINTYRSGDPAQNVKLFQSKMPPVLADDKKRQEILQNLPAIVRQLQIKDPELTEKFRRFIAPVLKIYGREKIYDLIIFKHSTPIILSDSGVVIVVSSGMIQRAESDDELFGYVAHEIGHEYFAQYSIYTKYLLAKVGENGKELPLSRRLSEMLALIELECDAFSAITLKYLGYNALAFIEGIERTAKNYSDYSTGLHPPESIRRQIVSEIVSITVPETAKSETNNLKISKGSISPQLAEIKSYINLNYSKPVQSLLPAN